MSAVLHQPVLMFYKQLQHYKEMCITLFAFVQQFHMCHHLCQRLLLRTSFSYLGSIYPFASHHNRTLLAVSDLKYRLCSTSLAMWRSDDRYKLTDCIIFIILQNSKHERRQSTSNYEHINLGRIQYMYIYLNRFERKTYLVFFNLNE